MSRWVVSVLVGDRVGVLRDITTPVTELGGNIDGISQTVVAGYFTVILTATFPEPRSRDAVREAIGRHFPGDEARIVVCPYAAAAASVPTVSGDRYVVTLRGRDRPGILKVMTTFLAGKGVNIENWYVRFEGACVTHAGEVTVPELLDIKQFQDEFATVAAGLDLRVAIQHENIFRVTNEVGPVASLLRGGRDAAN